MRPDPTAPSERDHGPHTLRVWRGTVVGTCGDDVFVELGPRMQGVISRRDFAGEPRVGEAHDFTLRGREDELWALALRTERTLASWEDMEPGSVVQARVVRRNAGGLELKIGPLHAFMPKSQTGLPREKDAAVLVGRTVTCEVIEVDAERQRVLVSRKVVLQRERASRHQADIGGVRPGQVVQGRVTRVEAYGAFVRFGHGLEGMVHVSNLSYDRVDDPRELVREGDALEVKVLAIRRGGRRIALGLKQMQASPWRELERTHFVGRIVEGRVRRVVDYGAFVEIARGVEGLLHASETGFPAGTRMRERLARDQRLALRITALDCERERLSLSLVHPSGARVEPDEVTEGDVVERYLDGDRGVATNLGRLLARALAREHPTEGREAI